MDRIAFKHLAARIQNMEEALEVLGKPAEYLELQDENFTVRQAYLQEQFASVNASVLHVLEKTEQKVVFGSYKERRAYEKEIRDPDECDLKVLAEPYHQGYQPNILESSMDVCPIQLGSAGDKSEIGLPRSTDTGRIKQLRHQSRLGAALSRQRHPIRHPFSSVSGPTE